MQLQFEELLREHPSLAEGEVIETLRNRFEENQKDKVEVLEQYL